MTERTLKYYENIARAAQLTHQNADPYCALMLLEDAELWCAMQILPEAINNFFSAHRPIELFNDTRRSPNTFAPRLRVPGEDWLGTSFLILHHTVVPLSETVNIFFDPKRKVSAHYVVSQAGVVYQIAPEAEVARHAGRGEWLVSRPDGSRLQVGKNAVLSHEPESMNNLSIGIEIVDTSGDAQLRNSPLHMFNPAQAAAVARLSRDIAMRNGISANCVLSHAMVDFSRKRDVDWRFNKSMLVQDGTIINVAEDVKAIVARYTQKYGNTCKYGALFVCPEDRLGADLQVVAGNYSVLELRADMRKLGFAVAAEGEYDLLLGRAVHALKSWYIGDALALACSHVPEIKYYDNNSDMNLAFYDVLCLDLVRLLVEKSTNN